MEFLCCNNILKTSDNASSARNEGSAGLGGRIRAVVTSQKHLIYNNTFQYIQMVNVPAGGQAGAARCCHRASVWLCGWVVQRSFQLIIDKMIDKGPIRILQIRLLAVMRYECAL